jgi:hypothetical protein
MTEVYGKITVKAPYSVAMDAIVRFLKARKNRIPLNVPLKRLGLGTDFGLEREVNVAFLPVKGHKGERQLHDELHLAWEPASGGPFPTFQGKLKMHPLGLDTELILTGEYQPPLGVVGEAFDAVIGKHISEATAQELLQALREGLEADYAAVKATIEGTPRP